MEELTALLGNVSIREELPDEYQKPLRTEFETVVGLKSLACIALAFDRRPMAQIINTSIPILIHQVNNLYFAMHGEKAHRFDEEDLELANIHAIHAIPEDPRNVFEIDENVLVRTSLATSNMCTELINYIEFGVSEFRSKHHKTNKFQCAKVVKLMLKLKAMLTTIVTQLENIQETRHKLQETIDPSTLTTREKTQSSKKRRPR